MFAHRLAQCRLVFDQENAQGSVCGPVSPMFAEGTLSQAEDNSFCASGALQLGTTDCRRHVTTH
jgi:hypothetical protein